MRNSSYAGTVLTLQNPYANPYGSAGGSLGRVKSSIALEITSPMEGEDGFKGWALRVQGAWAFISLKPPTSHSNPVMVLRSWQGTHFF